MVSSLLMARRSPLRFGGSSKLVTVFIASSPFSLQVAALSTSGVMFSLKDPTLLPRNDDVPCFDVFNPAATQRAIDDGSAIIAKVQNMQCDDVRNAIEKASSVLPSWRDGTTAHERSAILSRWSDLIKENTDDIATIMTLESGKPIQESQGEVAYGASFLDYYAAEAIRPTSAGGGFLTPTPFMTAEGGPRGKVIAVQEAVGVTALITPWNFPIAMITRKVGPALATGCTALVKPSELTPLTAIALKTLADRAGVPDGVFDLITCDSDATPDVGKEMCTNVLVKKISFTGSTRVGKQLMKLGSDTVKRLSLELGGNAPFIVFEDADISQAINAAMASKFRNAGQTCVCADRFLIHASIEEEFVSKLKEKVKLLSVSPGIYKGTTMGPLISLSAVLNVQKKVSEALDDGAECIAGGSPLEHLGPNFFEPTILRNVSLESRIWNSETFGPVAAIRTFETEEEAIQVANDSSTGLAAYFCSKDLARVFRVAGKLENGLVGVNDGIISTASAPFGGVKESGLGREGSQLGITEYLNTKYIFLNV